MNLEEIREKITELIPEKDKLTHFAIGVFVSFFSSIGVIELNMEPIFVLLICSLVGVSIEVVQLVFKIGTFDIMDFVYTTAPSLMFTSLIYLYLYNICIQQ